MTARTRPASGFTLIEVLTVVIILGIAAAIVVPQMTNAGQMTIQAAARMVVSDIVYAQSEAVANQQTRRVVFEPDENRYEVTDAAGTPLRAPWLQGDYIVDLDNDRRFTGVGIIAADFGGLDTLSFDELGAPSAGGTVDLSVNGHTYRVTVTAFTGRVTVEPL